jgi:hypothetical protein
MNYSLRHQYLNLSAGFILANYYMRNLFSMLREEHRLRAFENRVLKRIFGPNRDEVMGDWRKLHNDELHNTYNNQVKENDISRACSTNGEKRNAYRILMGTPEGKRPLGRPRLSWEDNIKRNLREIEWGDMDWIDLAQDRDQWEGSYEQGNEPSGSIKYKEVLGLLQNWRLPK